MVGVFYSVSFDPLLWKLSAAKENCGGKPVDHTHRPAGSWDSLNVLAILEVVVMIISGNSTKSAVPLVNHA